MRNVCMLAVSNFAALFIAPCSAQVVGGPGGTSTPTLPYIDWSGIEAYVNGSATGENYNAVDEGDDAEVKSSFTIVNPTNSSTTYSYKTYVNGQLYSSINTTTLGANTSVTIPQSFSSSNMQSDYVVSIRVRIDDGTVARGWTFDIDGMVMPPL